MKKELENGKLIIISGPSGVGKKTIIDEIYPDKSLNLYPSISMTTRKPRPNEINGIDYFFVSKEEFEKRIAANELLEYALYNNNYYGTPKFFVDKTLKEGKNVLLEIETLGLKKLLNLGLNCYKIFIAPPSVEILKERLIKRGTENSEVIEARVKKAEEELKHINLYDVCIINDDLESTIKKVKVEITKNINK